MFPPEGWEKLNRHPYLIPPIHTLPSPLPPRILPHIYPFFKIKRGGQFRLQNFQKKIWVFYALFQKKNFTKFFEKFRYLLI